METKLAGFHIVLQMASMLEVVVAHPLDGPSNVMVLVNLLMERLPNVDEMVLALRIRDSMDEVVTNVMWVDYEMRKADLLLHFNVSMEVPVTKLAFVVVLHVKLVEMVQN